MAELNDCHIYATCANTVGSFTCTCKDGFAGNGSTCTDIDECQLEQDNNCHANATCANAVGSFKCTCKDGYFGTGIQCNVIVSRDATVPEGKFVVQKTIMVTENVVRDVVQAEQGIPIDLTLPKYAKDKKNYEAAFKTESGAGDGTTVSYTSVPASGNRRRLSKEGSSTAAWTLVFDDEANVSATKALVSSQAFSDSISKSTGVSVSSAKASIATIEVALRVEKYVFVLSDHIECKDGFKGAGSECMDINECEQAKDNNCHASATCANTVGSFKCTCKDGFKGSGTECADFNECEQAKDNNCHTNATCENTVGSFDCTCKDGFEGDGTTCAACKQGFEGGGVECTDIDECQLRKLNNCHPHATCENTVPSFKCKCKDGFKGSGTECTDVNECDLGTDNCDARAACANSVGSFVCTCNDGFEGNGTTCTACKQGFDGGGVQCTDINECRVVIRTCHVNATCENTVGSFKCTCKDGFKGSGTECTDIDECKLGTHNCHTKATCTNVVASFDCACKDGFEGNGMSCIDVDECQRGKHNCHVNGECKNTAGSFFCVCKHGFVGNGMQCNRIVSRDSAVAPGKIMIQKTIIVTEKILRETVTAEQGLPLDLTLAKYVYDRKRYEVSFKKTSGAGDGTTVSYTSVPASSIGRRLSEEGSSKAQWTLVFDDDVDLPDVKKMVTSKEFSDSISDSTGLPVAVATALIVTIEVVQTVEKEVFVLVDDVDSCPYDAENDVDSDNMCHTEDTCPYDAENDADSDNMCENKDTCAYDAENDADSDTVCHTEDTCPYDTENDVDSDNVCHTEDTCPYDAENDADSDNMCHIEDTCPYDAENDADSDNMCGIEDTCVHDVENDADSDNMCHTEDTCPYDSENDADSDNVCHTGDTCPYDGENDADSDNVCRNEDTCPYDADNDADSDNVCHTDDTCPYDAENDADSDNMCHIEDTCPYDVENDADSDNVCRNKDTCPYDTENDVDSDTVCFDSDKCPFDVENDADSDGVCSAEQCSEPLCEGVNCPLMTCAAYAVGGPRHHLCITDNKCDTCSCSCAAKCFDSCPYDALNRMENNRVCNKCVMHNGGCNINRTCTNVARGVICGECSGGWTKHGATDCIGLFALV